MIVGPALVVNCVMEKNLDVGDEQIAINNDAPLDERDNVIDSNLKTVIDDHQSSKSFQVEFIGNGSMDDERRVSNDTVDAKIDNVELDTGDGRTPQVGMIFKSYEEVVNFYKRYALQIGFGVAVKKSSFNTYGLCRRLVLVCSRGGKGRSNECYQSRPTAKTNCSATIVAKLWGDGLLHIMEVNNEHNHPVNPSEARFMKCYKRLPSGLAKDLVVRLRGHDNLSADDTEILNYVEGRLNIMEDDSKAIYQFFAQMQSKCPNFFYLMDFDHEGHLRNVFWADGRSRAEYKFFNDVISFDTTCTKCKYKVPLVLFNGVNHHGQIVLLGCGLLSKESTENYFWVLKTWLTCMLGIQPNAIIINECKAIQGVSDFFPKSRLRICLWHVMNDIKEKLKEINEYSVVLKELEALIFDSFTVAEFEEEWGKLLNRFELGGSEWFSSLYNIRHLWVPVFLKNSFWAGMSIFQRNEHVSTFFEGAVFPETTISEFLDKYETFVRGRYEMEAKADFESLHNSPFKVTKLPMEDQISKLYTINLFRVFQDELKAAVHCHVTLVKVDGSVSIFKVKESNDEKGHEVVYNFNGVDMQCNCNIFQFKGVVCKHVLSIFKSNQVYELPPQYILDRWRKDYKQIHTLAHKSKDVMGNNIIERYDNLSSRYLQLAEVGAVSDEKYQHALNMIKELEMSLLDENMFQDLKSRLLVSERRINDNDDLSQMGFFENNKIPIPSKRRGRPPKKLKELNMEDISSSINNQDTSRALLIEGSTEALRGVSNAPHLDSHMRMHGGVDLMEEEANADELSFGNQFGMHANHHHVSNHAVMQPETTTLQFSHQPGNQSRMQWFYQDMLQDDQAPYVRRTG